MKLYRTRQGPIVETEGRCVCLGGDLGGTDPTAWDRLVNRADLASFLSASAASGQALPGGARVEDHGLLPPVGSQEVWAAGVTYFRSRNARMEEARESGGVDLYDRVYTAQRPELFFKATPHRVAGHGQPVRIRRDSRWNVPEPELTLLITSKGKIVGYTIGNDMSSRDIEGENPLYLPQAKVYDRGCALGPGILVTEGDLPSSTEIDLSISRAGAIVFQGSTTLSQMKRSQKELVEYLYRENSFPAGCFLMTGTGIVPSSSFSLEPGDEIRIRIGEIGTLVNWVT